MQCIYALFNYVGAICRMASAPGARKESEALSKVTVLVETHVHEGSVSVRGPS